jgi:glucuronoarabinoxylan endo-1,4-beta-xylanase
LEIKMNVNRFYACAFFSLIMLLGTSYGDVTNILVNPGFESSSTGNWAARSSTFSRVTSPVHSGSRSGRATGRTDTWNGIQQNVLGKMVVGQTYQVSGWIRTSTTASSAVHLSFEKIDGSGTNWDWGASGTANSNGWTYISGSYTLTVNGTLTGLVFYVEGPAAGIDIYLDDANVFGQVPGPPPPIDTDANGVVNFATVYQKLEGFGASGAFYEGWLPAHYYKNTLYDILFRDLGLDIYRIRNCYAYSSFTDTKTIVQAAKVRNQSLKILGTAWSPAAYLKSNNDINAFPSPGTLKKDANDPCNSAPYYYVYKAYAKWWADGLAAYESNSIHMDYISIQNECEFETDYDSCKFMPTETSSYAGYDKAFEAVYQKLNSTLGPNMPKMLAPETMGFGNAMAYINALTDVSHVYGYAHHLYSDGSYDSPDSFITGMTNFGSLYGYKPLLQTEYERLSSPGDDFSAAMNMALHIHNSLVHEGVCSYFHWSLFWGDAGGLVTLINPWGGTSASYTINPTYYILKHYAKFTDPGWHRVAATEDSCDLRISAYKSPDDSNMSIVIINTTDICDINLTLSLGSTSPTSSEIYRTTSDANWSYVGTFNPAVPLRLPKKSITTIHLTGPVNFADCAAVQAGGYGLDSDLNGDCYVDSEDLGVIAGYWLHTDCISPSNCQGADFAPTDGTVDFLDFSDFGPQWMQCNNPQDANCTPNW